MTTSEWLSIIALIISTGGFAINARNWFAAGPQLRLSLMADAIVIPDDGRGDRLALTVYNRGTVPTQITHMVIYAFDNALNRWRFKAAFAGLVNAQNVPAKLEINSYFMGTMMYDDKTKDLRSKGQLYVGVISAHSKRNFLIKVPPPRPEEAPKTKIAAA
jgi:hypothetical protein